MTPEQQLCEAFIEARKEKNLWQKDLGKLVGKDQRTISRWERGGYMSMGIEKLTVVALALDNVLLLQLLKVHDE